MILDVAALCRVLNLSDKTIYKRLNDGAIKGVQDEKGWIVTKDNLKAYLNGQEAS